MRTLVTAGIALLVLAPTAPARAEPAPTQHDTWAFVDTTHADITRLQQPGGPAPSLTSPSTDRQISGLSGSQGGQRFAFLDITSDACCAHDRIVVKSSSGKTVRIFDDGGYAFSGFGYVTHPELSPSATRVVVTRVGKESANRIDLYDLVNGRTTTLAGTSGLTAQAWLNTHWLLATASDQVVTTSAVGGGPHQAVPGLTVNDRQFTVSPDGKRLAWSRRTSADGADTETSDLYVADLSVTAGGVATVSNLTKLVTGQDNVSPTWSRDGQRVVFVQATGAGGGGPSKPGFNNPIGYGKRAVVDASGGSASFYKSSLSVSQVVNLGPWLRPV